MHIKFFSFGKGGGTAPTKYLTDEAVYKSGELVVRDPLPEVLRGDAAMTRSLIGSSQNEWKYTSGVIAFHADDAPTEAQQQQVMNDFERLAFAGLESDQYNILWVRHTHEGNVELHMVTPRLELDSGKSFNIAPPGHLAAFDALRDAWNYEQGWARPDDPARQKLLSQNDKPRSPQLTERKAARVEITDWLIQRVESGLIKDRDDVLESLKEIGQITRAGKDYISVKPEGFTQAIKLKGALYDEKFSAEAIRNLTAEIRSGQPANPELAATAAREAREALERHIRARSTYNTQRYKPISQKVERTANHDAGRDAESTGRVDSSSGFQHKSSSDEPALELAQGDSAEPISLSHYLERKLGANRIKNPPIYQSESGGYSEPKYPKYIAHGIGVFQRERNPVFNNAKRTKSGCLQDEIRELGNQIQQIIKVGYDRARDTINRVITSVRDRIEAARDSFFRASKQLAGNGQQLATAAKQFDTSARTIEQTAADGNESIQRNQQTFSQGMAVVRSKRTDKLQQLKIGINLVESDADFQP